MSNAHNGGGLVWSPLFNISEKEKAEFKVHLKNNFRSYDLYSYCYHFINIDYFKKDDDEFEALQYAILKFLITHTTFASDMLNDEDYKKACDTFKRGQLNNGVLQNLIVLFLKAFDYFEYRKKAWKLSSEGGI